MAKVGDVVRQGDELGYTMEGRFHHKIMVPFVLTSDYTITWVSKAGSYNIDTVIAKAVDLKGQEVSFSMVQKWPVKNQLFIGDKIKATRMMDTGERIIDTQFPIFKGRNILLSRAIWRRKNGSSAPSCQVCRCRHRDCRRLRRACRRSGRSAAELSRTLLILTRMNL